MRGVSFAPSIDDGSTAADGSKSSATQARPAGGRGASGDLRTDGMSLESTPGYPPGVGLNPEPTKDEKLLAMLAHLLAFFGGGFIAPIVILAVKRDSKFVSFHAIQALLISFAWMGVFMTTFFGTVGLAFMRAPHPALAAHQARPPAEIFL